MPLIVLGREALTVEPGMRVAQMVVCPVARAAWSVVEALPGTARGAGGFGSTGAASPPPREPRRPAAFPQNAAGRGGSQDDVDIAGRGGSEDEGGGDVAADRTRWHITFGTYATRLHGDERPTVDLRHNTYKTPFVEPDPMRVRFETDRSTADAVWLTDAQRALVETALPEICAEFDMHLVAGAAPDERNHVHVIVDLLKRFHGKQARKLLKRGLTKRLNAEHKIPAPRWWAKGGSCKAVKDRAYRRNAFRYVRRQRMLK